MNKPLKAVKIGNSVGVILPKRLADRLHAEPGSMLSVAETENGIELRPFQPDFEAQMAVAREVMEHRKRALRELAK